MLKTSRHLVKSYASGSELLKEAKSLEPGCILLDIRMAGMDGLEVQQELQNLGVSLPVIIMTGHGDIPLSVRAMKAGAIDFIEKPFEKAVLVAAVDEAFTTMARSDSGRERAQSAIVRLQALTPRSEMYSMGSPKASPTKRSHTTWASAPGRSRFTGPT